MSPRRPDLGHRLGDIEEQLRRLNRQLADGVKGFDDLADTDLYNITNGQAALYDTATGKWIPGSVTGAGSGRLLVMSVVADSITSGGDYVTFDTVETSKGFASPSAGASWAHPISGVYIITYEHSWASYTGGGTIDVEVGGFTVNHLRLAAGSAGSDGRGTIAYFADSGVAGKIKVTQSSGSAQIADATVWVAISDPTAAGGTFDSLSVSPSPLGLTFDGTDLWYSTRTGDFVYRIDPGDGTVLQTLNMATLSGIAGSDINLYGLAWDGSHLWVASTDASGSEGRKLWRVNVTPGSESIVTTHAPPDAELRGLTYGDGHLWLHGGVSALIYKINPTTGATVTSFASPAGSAGQPYEQDGLAHDGTSLWAASASAGNIYEVNPSTGATIATFTVPAGISQIQDLTIRDGRLLAADLAGSQIADTNVAI